MKPLHIILILMAGLGVAAVVSLYGDTTKTVSFSEAVKQATENPGKNYVVRARLNKSKAIEYDPAVDPNKLVFYAMDTLGYEMQVRYNHPKPTDMERSEMITMTGHVQGKQFFAEEIQMKCPSKYEDAPVNGKEYPGKSNPKDTPTKP